MSDIIDDAQVQSDLALEIQLRMRKKSPQPTGFCHNCDAVLPTDRLHYCDGECARDHEVREAARARNGNE